ncbi:MAG: ABC transporter permease subunit, partial [Chloroflexi bacterium]|nr:ABC transporter permease subunit [Chloroflexota bacterium]
MASIQPPASRSKWLNPTTIIVAVALLLFLYHLLINNLGLFPEEWNFNLRNPLDEFKKWVIIANRDDHWLFAFFFQPLKTSIDFFIRRVEDFLFWLPWTVIVGFVFLLAHKIGRLQLALLTSFSLFAMGLLGLWDESMKTLGLMVTAVIISLLIGIPLGVWTARNDRAETFLRPILDAMQTMPAFVYLIPVVLFFGIARVPSVIATIIYAIPPVVRLTNLGIRRVSEEAIEAARAFGSTERQLLYKVQIPQALPSIMAGVNQTIMMALSIAVIAALIGGGGLGDVVLKSLRRLQVGAALEAGLAIVFMAILLDRLSIAFSQIEHSSIEKFQGFRLLSEKWQHKSWAKAIEKPLAQLYKLGDFIEQKVGEFASRPFPNSRQKIQNRSYLITSILLLLLLTAVSVAIGWVNFPKSLDLSLNEPVDVMVKWAQVNLYQIGDT